MSFQRFKQKFLSLPLEKKLIAIGGIVAILGVFLPWYEDLDAFHTGDMFLGISGPLYLIGFVILLLALASTGIIVFQILDKKIPNLPLKEAYFYILASALSLFLLVITNSVYFHPKFGVNITLKEFRFGMIMTFVGVGLIFFGGIMGNKKKGVFDETEAKIEPLIDMSAQERDRGEIRKEEPVNVPEHKVEMSMPKDLGDIPRERDDEQRLL